MSKTYQTVPVDGLVQAGAVFICGLGPGGAVVPIAVDASGAFSGSQVGLSSTARVVSVSVTRPSNTTAYDAGDAIGAADAGTPANPGTAIMEFANIGPSAGVVMITDVILEIDVASLPSGMSGFKLRLYNASPGAILDAATWDLSSAGDRGKYLGHIPLSTPTDVGSTLLSENTQVNKVVQLAGTSLFAVLTSDAGFTPTSGAVKKITIATIAL